MKLIYDSERFLPIVSHLEKKEVNEEGSKLSFEPFPHTRIVLDKKHEEIIFLSSHVPWIYNRIKSYSIDRKKPGLLFISNRPMLHQQEVINRLFLDHTFPLERVIFLGQHSWTKAEHDFMKNNKLQLFSMKEITHEGLFEVSESVMSIAKEFTDLYLFIDSHVLEYPTIRGGKAGGMTARELIFFLQRFKKLHNLRMTELLISPLDTKVAMKLLSEIHP